jgi:hypothetical protein
MKKTTVKKLRLESTTLRRLATDRLSDAHGALRDTHTCRFCPLPTQQVSLCNSCYNSDCCLEVP